MLLYAFVILFNFFNLKKYIYVCVYIVFIDL